MDGNVARQLAGFEVEGADTGTTITVADKPGAGGANHDYEIAFGNGGRCRIRFQNGPVKEAGVNGVTHEQLLAIVRDRLESFQAGPFPSDHNAAALAHVQSAIGCLHDRTHNRLRRGVEFKTVA